MQRLRAVLLALGVVLVMSGLGAGVLAERANERVAHDAGLIASNRSGALHDRFAQARAVTLLTARSSNFARYYRLSAAEGRGGGAADALKSINESLAYLSDVYPDSLAEAGLVDQFGAENARVTHGDVVASKDLDRNRATAPFFRPTLRLPFGKVYLSQPYISPNTREWVVAHATKVDLGTGPAPAVVYFELTLESLRLALYDAESAHRLRIVDVTSGRVVIDSTVPQQPGMAPNRIADRNLAWVRSHDDSAVVTAKGLVHVVQLVPVTPNNANDWAIVVSTPATDGAWASPWSIGPLACLVAGLLLLALSVLGYLAHGRTMHRAARRDELTGLANRQAVRERAEARVHSKQPVTVLLLDLDRFKPINDTLGHAAGDELLAITAQRLQDLLREADDVVGRLGGDEFVLLASRLDEEAVEILCRRIAVAVSAPVTLDGVEVAVGVSIGVAFSPDHGSDYGTLLRCADVAMYHAKVRRAGWQVYSPRIAPDSRAEIAAKAELRHAVTAGEFDVHLQPTFDLVTGDMTRAEALVRWRHPSRGLLMPGHFIPMAEATGTIRQLTNAVLGLALDQHERWASAGHNLPVSVNVSAHDLVDPSFAEEVLDALATRSLAGRALMIELTETALLTDTEAAQSVLRTLADAGVSIAIDDFGSGYASLIYLRRYPITLLKLDRSLVRGVTESDTDLALARWTIEMAHTLKIRCVAEGIENEPTLAVLRQLGCDEGQGFLLQPPMPGDALLATLDAGSRLSPQLTA